MKVLLHASQLLTIFILSGCVAAAVNTTTYAVKANDRDALFPLAEAGDATAQYRLGESFCCLGPGFSTQTATQWLCKSAHQGNADAMYELGRIYSGDISRSVAPGQKLRAALSARESPSHALLWLSLAAEHGHTEAAGRLAGLDEDISEADRLAAANMTVTWREQSCEYDQVFAEH